MLRNISWKYSQNEFKTFVDAFKNNYGSNAAQSGAEGEGIFVDICQM